MKHMIIPDTQVKPGSSLKHLEWAGKYAVEKKPDVIVRMGDDWEMISILSWDVGKTYLEGCR